MSLNRRNPRRDANELEIVRGLEALGCRVLRIDNPDLLVLHQGRVFLMEVKTARGRLTRGQQKLLDDGWPIAVVTTLMEACCVLDV
jgi:hypothetical protein